MRPHFQTITEETAGEAMTLVGYAISKRKRFSMWSTNGDSMDLYQEVLLQLCKSGFPDDLRLSSAIFHHVRWSGLRLQQRVERNPACNAEPISSARTVACDDDDDLDRVLSMRTFLDAWLPRLTYRERHVIILRYGLSGDCRCYTLEEVGRIFKTTRQRIRQIESKALKRLKIYAKHDIADRIFDLFACPECGREALDADWCCDQRMDYRGTLTTREVRSRFPDMNDRTEYGRVLI